MADNKPSAANKYSIYQQRDLESEMVDWGAIAVDINAGIKGVMAEREARKDAITKNTQEALDKLSEVQDVDNTDIQSLLIDGSDNSKKALMEANYLLKNGLMTEKDYALIVQQQKSGYSALNNLAKNADAKYKEAMTRLAADCAKGPCSSAIEEWNNNTLLGFGNLKNTKLVSNPLTGELQMVRLIKNPNYKAGSTKAGEIEQWIMPDPKTHPENYQSPNQMTKASTFKLDKVNSKDLAKAQTENVGSIITATIDGSVLAGKNVTHVTNFKQIFDLDGGVTDEEGNKLTFDEFMNSQVDAVVGPADQTTNMNSAQILSQEMGYELAGSCDEVKERTNNKTFDCSKWIEITNSSGTPVVSLTEAQQKAARNKVRMEMLVTLDNETKKTATAGQQKNIDRVAEAKKEKEEDNFGYIKQINQMVTGDLQTAKNTAQNIVDQFNSKLTEEELKTKGIRGIIITEDRIRIIRNNKDEYEVNRQSEDDQGVISTTTIQKDVANIFNQIVPGALDDPVNEEEIDSIIKSRNYTFGERRTDDLDLNYRVAQGEVPNVSIGKSDVLKGQDPIAYMDSKFGDTTRANDTEDDIGPVIKEVYNAIVPPQLNQLVVQSGFPDPLNTFEIIDTTAGTDIVRFEFAGQKFEMCFAGCAEDDNKTPQQIQDEMLKVINAGRDAINKKRGRGDFDLKMSFIDWKDDKKANPTGSTSWVEFQKWLKAQ